MPATRFILQNTTLNKDAALAMITLPACIQFRIFASTSTDTPNGGRATNLPYFVALAILDTDKGVEHRVYDGMFLTAARPPRYQEVRLLLDAAQDNPKVWAGTAPVPFTEGMTPADAVAALMAVPVQNFTTASRKAFFRLLCNITEADYANL